MSRLSPRFVPADSLVEITSRTYGGRYLLAPCDPLNEAIRAILGRALALFPVDLHAISFMSNHWHALASVADAGALMRFVQHVNSNIARFVNRLRGWEGPVFAKASYSSVSADSEEDRLRYILSQGVKEGLVRQCVDWPGLHSSRVLLLGEVWVGRWKNHCHARAVRVGGGRGGGRTPSRAETEIVYPIDFSPLPSWRSLDAGERRIRVKAIVDSIEGAARAAHRAVLGVRAVLATDPFTRSEKPKRGPAPSVHTADHAERAVFSVIRATFVATFFAARRRIRRGHFTQLPPGCFTPVAPFSRSSAVYWRPVKTPANRSASLRVREFSKHLVKRL